MESWASMSTNTSFKRALVSVFCTDCFARFVGLSACAGPILDCNPFLRFSVTYAFLSSSTSLLIKLILSLSPNYTLFSNSGGRLANKSCFLKSFSSSLVNKSESYKEILSGRCNFYPTIFCIMISVFWE